MRRQVALGFFVSSLIIASCGGSNGHATVSASVGPLHHARTAACAAAGMRVVDYLLGGSSEGVPKIGNPKAVRKRIQSLPKRARRRQVRALANAGIVMCDQMARGVAWSTKAARVFDIPSESMVPALKPGDQVIVNTIVYKVDAPKRGDIVVFKAPPASSAASGVTDLVKRLVGLPGETIEGRDGRIYIDGRPLEEPYLPPAVQSRTFAPETVPPNSYFMLGDNRQYSQDSTYFGSIARADLIGPATKI